MTGMDRARPFTCVMSLLVSLFCLQVTFAGGYAVPLLVGGLSGGLAVAQALMLRRMRLGLARWMWTTVAVIAALNLVMNLPRYAWTMGHLAGGQ